MAYPLTVIRSTVVFLLSCCLFDKASTAPPHIVFIFADDLGWNDVSMHGSPSIRTPNIDALAASGVVLHDSYAQWSCSPSRGSFMSGMHAVKLGLQNMVIVAGEAYGLPLNITTLPQHLKGLGYSTHLVGKWHLGFMKKEYTPTARGFDSFFGYYTGMIDYFTYINTESTNALGGEIIYGKDIHNGTHALKDFVGGYATYDFTKKAADIIEQHDTNTPLFLYLSHAAVHAASTIGGPEKAPLKDVLRFKYITSLGRRIHAARVAALDDSVGQIFEALHNRDMLSNCLVVFASDNGGDGVVGGHGSNYPLRGNKGSLWEGGVRVPALIWSPLLTPRVSRQFMHVTDWMPTLYEAAGGSTSDLGPIDGLSMWTSLKDNLPGPRTEVLLNHDQALGMSAYIRDHLKVINGSGPPLKQAFNDWFLPTGFEDMPKPASMEEWVFEEGSKVRDVVEEIGLWPDVDLDAWYDSLVVQCQHPVPPEGLACDLGVKPCLFNVTEDPCEYHDLADDYPEVVQSMMEAIESYENVSMPIPAGMSDPLSDPVCHDFMYVPWLDPEHYEPDCHLAEGATWP